MFKKSLVIGSLIAGAFVLPSVASAGKVQGPCVNCHTMHNMQGGVSVTGGAANGSLLAAANCAGCHSGSTNGAAGKQVGGFGAPQVTDSVNTLSGGFFVNDNAHDAKQHNVSDLASITQDGVLGLVPPGGVAMGAQLKCADCHNGSGGHHGSTGGFRLLGGVTGTPAANYGVRLATAAGDHVGARDTAQYTTSMNTKCASCHPGFHGNALGGNQQSATAGTWVRHPTDIRVNTTSGPSIVNVTSTTDTYIVPVGTDGTNDDMVLCLSCHVPHGSDNNDLLSFNYGGSGSFAGDNNAGNGCETCHNYSGTGM